MIPRSAGTQRGRRREKRLNDGERVDFMKVMPEPKRIEPTGERFAIDGRTVVTAPAGRPADLTCARRLARSLADLTGIGVPVTIGEPPRGTRAIRVATVGAGGWAGRAARALGVTKDDPGREGYVLTVRRNAVTVIGSDSAGALYGASTLLELVGGRDLGCWIEGCRVRDWPDFPVRGVHVYIPGRDQIPYFRRYMERFLLRYKFNTMILEVGGGARLDRHPEIATGWARTVREMYAHGERIWRTGESCPLGPGNRFQDSTHRGIGGGAYIEASDLSALCREARAMNISVIPEVQSLSHVYYLACPHREIAEVGRALFPDSYCPSDPRSYRLYFDVLDEYLAITGARAVHIGHDEWRAGGLCPRCRRKHTGDLFARDVTRIWRHLAARGRDLWMWGDHFVTKHNELGRSHGGASHAGGRGKRGLPTASHAGGRGGPVWYDYPSTLGARAKVSRATRSRPITITNWSWSMGVETDRQLADAGFRIVYGNFDGHAMRPGWEARSSAPGILGAAVSSWCAMDEFELGKMHVAAAAYAANLLWSRRCPPAGEIDKTVAGRLPDIASRLGVRPLPTESSPTDRRLVPLDLSRSANAPLSGPGWDLGPLSGRTESVGRVPVRIGKGRRACVAVRRPDDAKTRLPSAGASDAGERLALPAAVSILMGRAVQGLVFWHATSGPGGRTVHAGDSTHFPRESSDLVAVYEVEFADALVLPVECRYAENIASWNAPVSSSLYWAPHHLVWRVPGGRDDTVICGHEWRNPRADVVIRAIRFKGCRRRAQEPGAPTPAVILLALTAVEKPRLSDYRAGTRD